MDPKAIEFVDKLEKLLEEYDFTLMGDHLGEVILHGKSGHMIGWWTGQITKENFHS